MTQYAALSKAGDPVERLPAVVEFEVSCCVLPDIRNFGRRNMFVWIFLGVVGLLVILTLPPVAKAVRTGTDIVNFLIFAMAIAFILWLALAM